MLSGGDLHGIVVQPEHAGGIPAVAVAADGFDVLVAAVQEAGLVEALDAAS